MAAVVRSLDPGDVRAGAVAVLARTNAQLPRLARALDGGRASRCAATSSPPARRSPRPRAHGDRPALGQPAAGVGPRRRSTADRPPADDRRPTAERRVAAAVLDFLRDQPFGDGAAPALVAGDDEPVRRRRRPRGVDLLTFHAAKGREWPTVVVTGVETGLVPHRSATTNAGARRGGPAAARRRDPSRRPPRDHVGGAARRLPAPAEPADRRHRHRRGRRCVAAAAGAARRAGRARDPRSTPCRRGATRAAVAAGILPDRAVHRRATSPPSPPPARRRRRARRRHVDGRPHRGPPAPRHPRRLARGGSLSRGTGVVARAQPRYLDQGPVIASVMPGLWMLTKRTLPSGENVGPVNSEYVGSPLHVPMTSWLRAIA